jgi:hypothetical protein
MADTVYNYPEEQDGDRGEISFTRFFRKGEDWIQITIVSEDVSDICEHTYASMPYRLFAEAFKACAVSVNDTKGAWWHDLTSVSNKSEAKSGE